MTYVQKLRCRDESILTLIINGSYNPKKYFRTFASHFVHDVEILELERKSLS